MNIPHKTQYKVLSEDFIIDLFVIYFRIQVRQLFIQGIRIMRNTKNVQHLDGCISK